MGENLENSGSQTNLIKDCVRELQRRFPGLSSTQIAIKIGMSQSTFSRIENGQTRPNVSNISKLLSAAGKTHQISEAVLLSDPKLMAQVKNNLSHNFETPIMGGEFAKYFSVPDFRKIILLALTNSGTTRVEIQTEYGNSGIKKLEDLLKVSIIFEDRGIIRANEEKVSFTQDLLKESLISCINDNYDPEKFGKALNWLSFQTESVNKSKAMKLIHARLQKTYKEIKEEILYSPEYQGNDKVFIGMVADSLLSDRAENLELKQ